MTPTAVDLHAHTIRSDGLLSPAALLDEMTALEMSLVAISDHDTLAGYRELRDCGRVGADEARPHVLPAIEINSIARHAPDLPEGELHILGLGVDPDDDALEAALDRQRAARAARISAIVGCLADIGVAVDDHLAETLPADVASAGRPHLARALIRAGHAATVSEAFDRYLAPGRPAYRPGLGMDTRAAIDLIRGAGGIAVLAHFALAPSRPEVIAELRDWGLVGLEVYYSKWDAATVAAMAAAAEAQGLLATAGTDFHGDVAGYPATAALVRPPVGLADRVLGALDRHSVVL